MKWPMTCWKCACSSFSKIHLVDRCLIIFMFVLLVQSSFTLFIPIDSSSGASNIDIVIRTSSAAIFGYFLSANFIRHTKPGQEPQASGKEPPKALGPSVKAESTPQARIGFALPDEPATETGTKMRSTTKTDGLVPEESSAGRFQIITATSVGLFCLIMLVLVRDLPILKSADTSTTATIAQFRDFVSGCVGFLIGCPTSKEPRR